MATTRKDYITMTFPELQEWLDGKPEGQWGCITHLINRAMPYTTEKQRMDLLHRIRDWLDDTKLTRSMGKPKR